jgi:hypothetical protein
LRGEAREKVPALPITIGAPADGKPITLERADMNKELVENLEKALEKMTSVYFGNVAAQNVINEAITMSIIGTSPQVADLLVAQLGVIAEMKRQELEQEDEQMKQSFQRNVEKYREMIVRFQKYLEG